MNKHTQHDFAGLDDWFEVFTSGEHTDSRGRTATFSDADLDSVVANHNAAEPAPFVVGHPKHNDPAYGWTGDLKREGQTLFAKGVDVVTEFSDAVRAKHFPNRSISLDPVEGGGYTLRHIGFLGAKRPAVSGLANIEFATGDDSLTFDFAMTDEERWAATRGQSVVARVLRGFRDWLIDDKGLETADRLIPDYEIESIESAANDLRHAAVDDTPNPSNFAEPSGRDAVPAIKTFTQEEMDAATTKAGLDATAAATLANQSALRFAARTAEAVTLVDDLVKQGRLLPAQTEGLVEFIAGLPEEDAAAFEFSAADGDTTKTATQTPAAFMANFMGALGKQIELGADGRVAPDDQSPPASDYHGHNVAPDRAELDQKARDYMAQHEGVDYVTAVIAVEGG